MTERERVAVVGAGLMGHGIAQVFAAAGHRVTITDQSSEILASVHERVRSNLRRVGLEPDVADAIELRDGLEATIEDAALVIEAVPEDLALKRGVFARLERAAPADAILATNTSVIAIGEIARDTEAPGRVIGTHFWNPPYLIPLVEVTQAELTQAVTVKRTMAILARAGKSPVHVRHDIPGFVGNRLQHALWREAIALVEHGVCDAEVVDAVIKQTLGLRLPVLGPLENADLVGLDLTLAIHEYVLPHLERRPEPSPLLRRLVEQRNLGMKTGQGFRHWTPEDVDAVQERLLAHLVREDARRHATCHGEADHDPSGEGRRSEWTTRSSRPL
jgi:3-hydroxybutyryl-CoA dehydrogenase